MTAVAEGSDEGFAEMAGAAGDEGTHGTTVCGEVWETGLAVLTLASRSCLQEAP
jgi:hypothetical protein